MLRSRSRHTSCLWTHPAIPQRSPNPRSSRSDRVSCACCRCSKRPSEGSSARRKSELGLIGAADLADNPRKRTRDARVRGIQFARKIDSSVSALQRRRPGVLPRPLPPEDELSTPVAQRSYFENFAKSASPARRPRNRARE